MGVVTVIDYIFEYEKLVAVSAYMGVVTWTDTHHGRMQLLQSPPTWEL